LYSFSVSPLSILRPAASSTLFPYTTLFRSGRAQAARPARLPRRARRLPARALGADRPRRARAGRGRDRDGGAAGLAARAPGGLRRRRRAAVALQRGDRREPGARPPRPRLRLLRPGAARAPG